MSKLRFFVLILTLGFTTTSCYRMPGEDEYSLVPFTNNPDVTRDKGSLVPGASI